MKYLKLFEGYKEVNKSNKNPAIWKGKRFWIGVVSLMDGQIEEVHTYEMAETSDFHHNFYFSIPAIERMRNDESAAFWVDDGEIMGQWRHNIDRRIKYKILNQIQISYSNNEGVNIDFNDEDWDEMEEVCDDTRPYLVGYLKKHINKGDFIIEVTMNGLVILYDNRVIYTILPYNDRPEEGWYITNEVGIVNDISEECVNLLRNLVI